LFERFEVIVFEEFTLLIFVVQVLVEVLEEGVELALGLALEAGEVSALFHPDVPVECQFVLLLDVL
jgi:AMMECR1 domain-containing protein